ncbi:heme-binding protein [Catenovulum agarivorans DS-2]|uniref:Heme-binding protein n=1 Tax=Catenovulum agarivorans DS-2 TaxID=1328313 RepID=W7QKI3_9ALTE|nr:TlpA disulfide reductase family protein [Catenovulum agarivorans]EWH08578.1 heme-binding protein [Catenovulum agarivorans DS-2]
MSLKRMAKWAIELFFMLLIISAFFWFQSRNMLETGHRIERVTVNGQVDKWLNTQMGVTEINLASGDGPSLVYFIAPWCSVCHLSIDNLQSLYADYPGKLNLYVIALSFDNSDEVVSFVEQHSLTFPIYLGDEKLAQSVNVSAFPSYYYLDNQGEVVAKAVGYTTETELKVKHWLHFE